jgi:hypothetical protein
MPHNLTESSTFTAAVEVPDDGDLVRASSVETGFQALANRTKHLNDNKAIGMASSTDNEVPRLDGAGGKQLQTSGMRISDAIELEFISAKTRTVFLALETGFNLNSTDIATQWQPSGGTGSIPYFVCSANSRNFFVPVPSLPLGAVVNRVRFGLQPGIARAGANRMTMSLWKSSANTTTGDATNAQVGSSQTDDATANVQLREIDLSGTPYTVVTGDRLHVIVAAGNTAGANPDFLIWIEVRYTDPGPRSPGG